MDDTINFINMEGLQFFGKVNASISHELKNILAIISETAGLLNDLTEMAKQGQDIKLSLLDNCSQSIAEDIQRGFLTIKQMNRFAHSVDTPIKEINIFEILDLTVNLSSFLRFANKVKIQDPDKKIKSVLTCPFLLQNLIYKILIFMYESIDPDDQILIKINSKTHDDVHIVFSSSNQLNLKDFPTQKTKKIMKILGVEFTTNISLFELDIWIPYVSDKIITLAKLFLKNETEKTTLK